MARKASTAAKSPARKARAAKAAPAPRKELTTREADAITLAKSDSSGGKHMVVTSAGGATVTYALARQTPELKAAAVIGGSFKQVNKLVGALPKPEARLARGTDSRSAPHSAKAVRDQNGNGKSATPKQELAAKPSRAERKAADKASRAAKRAERAAPKADDTRKITVVDKKFVFGGEGTARRACWDAVKSGITVAAYIAAGGKAKYLPRWVSAGAIKLG